MIEEVEKKIYNQYLRAQADKYKRPYMVRKDFSKMRDKEVLALQKLRIFFEQYKDVNPFQFFKAGFKYELDTYPTLEYFTTLRATSLYVRHMREKYYEDVDNHQSIRDFKDGILFIYNFIADNDLTLGEYKTCVNGNGVPWCIIHLKKQNISFYHIHALEIDIDVFPEDYREMITDDFQQVFYQTMRDYEHSKTMREIGTKFNKFSQRLIKAAKKSKNNDKIDSTAGGTDSVSAE